MFPALLPTYNRADVAFVRGEGSFLFAEDGRQRRFVVGTQAFLLLDKQMLQDIAKKKW